jgi:hypothetical protein
LLRLAAPNEVIEHLLLHLLKSPNGTPRHFTAMHYFGRFRSEADMDWQARPAKSVANDPFRHFATGNCRGAKGFSPQ